MTMYEFKAETRNMADIPTVESNNTHRIVEVVQIARRLSRERTELEDAMLKNQAEIARNAGLLQEMLKAMYQEDPVVKYLADAILFHLGGNGIDPQERPSPF